MVRQITRKTIAWKIQTHQLAQGTGLYQRAERMASNVIGKKKSAIFCHRLTLQTTEEPYKTLIDNQPELQLLQHTLHRYFQDQCNNRIRKIRYCSSMAIYNPQGRSWTAHTRSQYYGPEEYFSNVTIMTESGKPWFANLRLIFDCHFNGECHELAFIRWYEVVDNSPRPYTDSFYLRWDPAQIRVGRDTYPNYDIIDIQTIVGLAYIQKDHGVLDGERFFVNKYIR